MRVKDIVIEDFVNYRRPCMFIASAFCDWKCCTENGLPAETCQNSSLAASPTREVADQAILRAFRNNELTEAVVIGGLEPFQQTAELVNLLQTFRAAGEQCPFVIYTGYYPTEIAPALEMLRPFGNIIVKFGRYRPGDCPHIDPLLGVPLVSSNQYAVQIS